MVCPKCGYVKKPLIIKCITKYPYHLTAVIIGAMIAVIKHLR